MTLHFRKRMTLVAAVVLFGTAPAIVNACKCAPVSLKKAVAQSDAVFVGQVTDVKKTDKDLIVQMVVTKMYKGPEEMSVEVKTAFSPVACGFQFDADTTYLIFATQKGGLTTGACSRTAAFPKAEADAKMLDAMFPTAEGAWPNEAPEGDRGEVE